MHIVILTLYGFTVWISAIAYAAITETWRISYILLSGPVIISTAVTVLALADYALWSAITAHRNRRKARRLAARRREA